MDGEARRVARRRERRERRGGDDEQHRYGLRPSVSRNGHEARFGAARPSALESADAWWEAILIAVETGTQPSQTPSRRDFWEKLILLVVDKLVFGLLIVLAAFALNRTLEHYRADAAMMNQVAEKRVDRIAAFWSLLDEQHETLLSMRSVADRRKPELQFSVWIIRQDRDGYTNTGVKIVRSTGLVSEWQHRDQTIARLLSRDRFWFGDTLHQKYRDYAKRETDLGKTLIQAEGLAYDLQRIAHYPRPRRTQQLSKKLKAYSESLQDFDKQRDSLLQAQEDVLDVLKRLT